MNDEILIGFVLDKSGSMGYISKATVEGFNEFVDSQREYPGKTLFSLTLFDTRFDVRYVAEDIKNVAPLGSFQNPYVTGGNTALYDAVGTTVKGIEAWQQNNPEFGGKVKIVILTDGQENSSREWHIVANPNTDDQRDVNNLIQYKQGEGWEFIFLGTGQSAWLESRKFTALADAAVYNFAGDAHSNRVAYASAGRSMSHSRMTGQTYGASLAQDSLLRSVAVNRGDEDKLTSSDEAEKKLGGS